MANRNDFGRRERGNDYDRDYRRDRQAEQFQPGYDDDYGREGAQMGDTHLAGRSQYAGNEGELHRAGAYAYDDERYGSSWRQEPSPRSRSYPSDPDGDFGGARVDNRERAGFGSFNSETYRTAGNVGPREHQGYGRGDDVRRGAYSRGSYGAGTYGAAPRRDHGDDRGFFERAGDEVASWFGDEDAARRREIDHRGRGPSNYTRSDARILEDCCDRLTEDWGVDASNVQVTVQDGEVTLDGNVENRRQKRRAEDVVHEVTGVGHVQNNLRTQDTTRGNESASQATERNGGTLA